MTAEISSRINSNVSMFNVMYEMWSSSVSNHFWSCVCIRSQDSVHMIIVSTIRCYPSHWRGPSMWSTPQVWLDASPAAVKKYSTFRPSPFFPYRTIPCVPWVTRFLILFTNRCAPHTAMSQHRPPINIASRIRPINQSTWCLHSALYARRQQ